MLTIAGSPGCFYILPLPPPVFNDPPVIRSPLESPAIAYVQGTSVTLRVTASDPEGDKINFDWFGLEGAVIERDDEFPQGDYNTSSKTISDATPLRERPTVRVLVQDGHHDNGVEVRFDLVFP